MVKDAEAHAGEDKKRRELVEARNQADALIHSTEKALGEHGDKVSADEKTAIEAGLAGLKEAVKGDDLEDIKAKTNTLAQASMKLGEAMYKAQQAEAGGRRTRPPTAPATSPTTMWLTPTSRKSTTTRKALPKPVPGPSCESAEGHLFQRGGCVELPGP